MEPLTEEQAEEAGWPCWMCMHHLGSHTPEKEVCKPCQRATAHAKPDNFELQTAVLLPTQPRDGVSTNTIKRS